MTYPVVADEFKTLDLVCGGHSIARYGDGEFNLARGGNCISQVSVPGIRKELCNILLSRSPSLLVGIPNLDSRSPKFSNWTKLSLTYAPLLAPKKQYYSSFITRPDSSAWISTEEYFDRVESLWRGAHVTMVYGSTRSLSAEFPAMATAKSIVVVSTPRRDSYAEIDRIVEDIKKAKNNRVLLMCGPAATCLAARLDELNFHAIDLGHIGMWWRSYLNPKLCEKLRYLP